MQDLFEKPSRRLAEEDKRQMNLELLPERDNVRVYKDAFDLLLFVYRTTATMRREYRFTLAEEMKRALQQLLTSIYEAKKTTPRAALLSDALHWVYEAKVLYRVMDELKLQLDISGYFMSIDRWKPYTMAMDLMVRIGRHRNAKGQLLKDLPKHRLVEQLLAKVILYDPMQNCEVRDWKGLFALLPRNKSLRFAPEGVGLPIGNLTSQMFSNLYMNCFDQWVKRHLKVRHYGRYVDDSYYISVDREWLLSLVPQIDEYLRKNLGLHLNLQKTKLTEIHQGITFLGVHLKPHRRYLKTESLLRMRQRVKEMTTVSKASLKSESVRHLMLSKANSMLGMLSSTSSYNLRKDLFPNYPMYTFAHGTRGMKKFEMNKEITNTLCLA